MENIKTFLEADARRTQVEWEYTVDGAVFGGGYWITERNMGTKKDKENNQFIAAASRIAPEIRNLIAENKRLNTLLKIREAAYDMENKAGKEIERLSEQNAAMQDAFELVFEVLGALRDDILDDRVCDATLTAAAPYRKTGV